MFFAYTAPLPAPEAFHTFTLAGSGLLPIIALLAALGFVAQQWAMSHIRYTRKGGLRFVKVGRLNVSYSLSRR